MTDPTTTLKTLKIVMVGAGNVASSLAPALDALDGVEVVEVWSRTTDHSAELASHLRHATVAATTADITPDADLYLISVADDAVATIARQIKCRPGAVAAHTSGGVDASALSPMTPHYGVFYPLQTFTRGVKVDLRPIPLFVEGADDYTTALLDSLAHRLSDHARHADSHRRAIIHAAAVFACNFANHCFSRADDILRGEGLTLDVLQPLIAETVRKASAMRPRDAQTGPARRNDTGCISHHEQLLDSEQRQLYHTLSQAIIDYYSQPTR